MAHHKTALFLVVALVVLVAAAFAFRPPRVEAQGAGATWQLWEDQHKNNKGFRAEMQPGPHPNPDPQGEVVHVISTRGNQRNGGERWWIEAGFRYKAYGTGHSQPCNCWAIFYSTNTISKDGKKLLGNPNRDAYLADIGPAAPRSTHTFEFASNDAGGFEVWIDGILRTVLPLPPDAWTDFAGTAQTEVHTYMETVDADFENEVFFHSPFRQNYESLIGPFVNGCSYSRMPRVPGVRRTVFSRDHYHDGPSQSPSCN